MPQVETETPATALCQRAMKIKCQNNLFTDESFIFPFVKDPFCGGKKKNESSDDDDEHHQ